MKRAVILHGTDANPDANWFPWLKHKLEAEGYDVWAPLLPNNHAPNRQVYNDFIFSSGWDIFDNIVIGHSSGAVSVLNMLMDDRCPRVKLAVMVSAWKGGVPNGYELPNSQFDNLFPPNGFDFTKIGQHAETIKFLHSDDDPYCPLEQAQWLAEQMHAPLTVMHDAHHIGAKYSELPQVWQLIESAL